MIHDVFTPLSPVGIDGNEPLDDECERRLNIRSFKMAPHQERVIAEKTDLDDKLSKLLAFFQTPVFASLPEAERSRLRNQARFMDGYLAVLEERIAAFGL